MTTWQRIERDRKRHERLMDVLMGAIYLVLVAAMSMVYLLSQHNPLHLF